LRSASSWSMASARRRSADASIEHTIEDYQVEVVRGPASRSPVVHRLATHACGKALLIIHREIPPKFFFRTAGGSRFRSSRRFTCGFDHRFHKPVPRLRTTQPACLHTLSTPPSTA
jgi:hypothetical protein